MSKEIRNQSFTKMVGGYNFQFVLTGYEDKTIGFALHIFNDSNGTLSFDEILKNKLDEGHFVWVLACLRQSISQHEPDANMAMCHYLDIVTELSVSFFPHLDIRRFSNV